MSKVVRYEKEGKKNRGVLFSPVLAYFETYTRKLNQYSVISGGTPSNEVSCSDSLSMERRDCSPNQAGQGREDSALRLKLCVDATLPQKQFEEWDCPFGERLVPRN